MTTSSALHLITSALAGLSVTIVAMLALRPIAYVIDLVDRPGGHKTHHGTVPVVGGIAMLLGLVMGLAVSPGILGESSNFVMSATLLVVVGMLDDRFMLGSKPRLAAQFVAVLPMFFGAGVRLVSFGDLFGIGAVHGDFASLLSTAFVTLAAINAFNMLDGMDGLAGGTALVSLICYAVIATPVASPVQLNLLLVLLASISGFLVFNVPVRVNRRIRCFMGDAGSTLIGFSVAWLGIGITQNPVAHIAPITTVWFVGVPATDIIWTIARRLARGHSPLQPDNEHLHHMLQRAGFGVRAVFMLLVGVTACFGAAGIALHRAGIADGVSMLALIGSGSVLVVTAKHAHVLTRWVPVALRRSV